MGCTPSKSAVIYSQDKVCRDLDTCSTCSTFVPSLKSSVSTPERPRLGLETSNGRQTYLSVPCRSVHTRSVSLSSTPECWGSSPPGSSLSASPISVKSRCQTPEPHGACSDLQ